MIRSLCIVLILGAWSFSAQAQVQQSGWLASFNTFKLSSKFSAHFDLQFRTNDNLEDLQTVLIRPGLNYHVNKALTLTAGYAFIPGRRTLNNVSGYLPEQRIWEQVLYAHKWKKVSISHRLRLEQRFLPVGLLRDNELITDRYTTAYRIRYFIRNILPLNSTSPFSKGWFLALQDELFLNTGNKENVNGKSFDQNRLYGAFGYRFPFKIDIEAGYMNQYSNTRTYFTNNHIVQLAVYKRL